MTEALEPLLADVSHPHLSLEFYTAPPSAPPSINDEATAALSTSETLPDLLSFLARPENTYNAQSPLFREYSAYLVACYSAHPLTSVLRQKVVGPVLNIFQASVLHAKMLAQPFGIVTTGNYWEPVLENATMRFLSGRDSDEDTNTTNVKDVADFVGVRSTGLSAIELHSTPREEVNKRIEEASADLVRHGAKVILLGCAGMSGMEEAVRAGAKTQGMDVTVVDGVRAGVVLLEGLAKAQKV